MTYFIQNNLRSNFKIQFQILKRIQEVESQFKNLFVKSITSFQVHYQKELFLTKTKLRAVKKSKIQMMSGFVVLKAEIPLIAKIYLAIINVMKLYQISVRVIKLNKRLDLAQFHLVKPRKIFANSLDRVNLLLRIQYHTV